MTLSLKIENLLFVAAKPLSKKNLATLLDCSVADIAIALEEVSEKFSQAHGGLVLIRNGEDVALGTHPDAAEVVSRYLQEERTSELTRPALETLTIIAYRGPVTKPEIELIRGVNCSLILRNLLMRGLVEEQARAGSDEPNFTVTVEFLKSLGVTKLSELPDYAQLSSSELFEKILSSDSHAQKNS